MSWKPLKDPLFPWMRTIDRIMTATRPPRISGPTMVVASDSGGVNSKSDYRTWVHLCIDLQASPHWETHRRQVRQQHLHDGRRMSYKALSDRHRRAALLPFLEGAELISGCCIATVFDKRIRRLCLNDANDHQRMRQAAELQARWKDRELEEALRVTHVVAALVGGLSQPGQNVYWIVDQDNLFGNAKQSRDVARLLSSFSSYYVRHALGELGIGTTALDEGDRLEEDMTSIPDLVAGALAETTTRLGEYCGGYIPPNVAVPYGKELLPKADRVAEWFWSKGHTLSRVAILFAQQKDGRYSVSRHEMSVGDKYG